MPVQAAARADAVVAAYHRFQEAPADEEDVNRLDMLKTAIRNLNRVSRKLSRCRRRRRRQAVTPVTSVAQAVAASLAILAVAPAATDINRPAQLPMATLSQRLHVDLFHITRLLLYFPGVAGFEAVRHVTVCNVTQKPVNYSDPISHHQHCTNPEIVSL